MVVVAVLLSHCEAGAGSNWSLLSAQPSAEPLSLGTVQAGWKAWKDIQDMDNALVHVSLDTHEPQGPYEIGR